MRGFTSLGAGRVVWAAVVGAVMTGAVLAPAAAREASAQALPDLQVTARIDNTTGSGGAVAPGALVYYTFTIENKGKGRANGAAFTATIPAGLELYDPTSSFGPNAYFKVASVGFQWVYDTAPDGQPHSTCTITPETDGTKTVSCRLGQYSGFFNPTLEDGLDILDPSQTNIVQFFVTAPAVPSSTVMTGNASTNNGDARPANNAVAITLQVK